MARFFWDIVMPLLTDKSTGQISCGGGCEPCMGTACGLVDCTLELNGVAA